MGSVLSAMGSVLSAAHAAVCSFADAQLDKAEARRLMAIYPGLRDMPADELEIHLRRLIDERKEQDKHPFDSVVWREGHNVQERRCNSCSCSKSQLHASKRINRGGPFSSELSMILI